jgi:uncharacterized glyoxalase superfamily protein PhnB
MSDSSSSSNGSTQRSQPESLRARDVMASFTVKDVPTSLAWYRDVVGFTVDERYERDGRLLAASLKAGAFRLLLSQDDGAKGFDRVKGEGFSVQLTTTQDVDAFAARIKEQGGTLVLEPTDTPWGRVFRVKDPDGFQIVISSPRA